MNNKLLLFAGLFDSLGNSEEIEGRYWSHSQELDCPKSSSFDQKISPPLALSEPRTTRSDSDPNLSKKLLEHRKSSQENYGTTSPKSARRNPFRMLSNAIDFRNRKKFHRPKSADCERGGGICGHPSGGGK